MLKPTLFLTSLYHTGSTTEYKKTDPSLGISGAVVNTLIKPYLNRGHTLFINNWHSSSSLANHLRKKKTNVTGTVQKNRKSMPTLSAKLKVGQTEKSIYKEYG